MKKLKILILIIYVLAVTSSLLIAQVATTADNTQTNPPDQEVLKIVQPVAETAGVVTTTADKIDIKLDNVELVDAVRMFTRLSDANIIVIPSNLQGRVTVNLTGVEWKPALESILRMHNLVLTEKVPGSGIYTIEPKSQEGEPKITRTILLKFARAAEIEALVKSMLDKEDTVCTFPQRNAIVIKSTASNIVNIEKVIESIDRPRDQVFIEAKFLELSDSAVRDLGINWQVLQAYNVSAANLIWNTQEKRQWKKTRTDTSDQWDNRSIVDTVNHRYDIDGIEYQEEKTTYEESPPGSGNWVAYTTITPVRTITDTIDQGLKKESKLSDEFVKDISDIRTAILSADEFRLVLSALKNMDGVSVISNPKIIVANEQEATIHIGRIERPFVATVTPATQTTAPFTTYNPGEPVNLGVRLKVTPTVNTESNITVKIIPELNRLIGYDVAPDGKTKYPIRGTKTIETVFSIESGKTVAIGGLTETSEKNAETKIPILGDIPIIGWLFKYQHKEKSQQETIIFVTVGLAPAPILRHDTGLPEDTELTREHLIRSKLIKNERNKKLEKIETEVENYLKAGTEKTIKKLPEEKQVSEPEKSEKKEAIQQKTEEIKSEKAPETKEPDIEQLIKEAETLNP